MESTAEGIGQAVETEQENQENAGEEKSNIQGLDTAVELDVVNVVFKEGRDFLKIKSVPVEEIDENVRLLAWSMAKTMYGEPGVGLAAPQIGVGVRLIVIDPHWTQDPKNIAQNPVFMINPEIIWNAPETNTAKESCLSVPGLAIDVDRFNEIEVKFTDLNGEEHEMWCDQWEARIVQHEIDHLDGITLLDKLSRLKADMYWRKIKKSKRVAKKRQKEYNDYARYLRAQERFVEKPRSAKLQSVPEEGSEAAGVSSHLSWNKPGED